MIVSPGPRSFDIVALRRRACREDFYTFLQEFWYEVIPEDPTWNWHMRVICHELQKVAERMMARKEKEYDLIINVPPGSTKSTIASIMFPAWMWCRKPEARFIGCSYDFDLSLEFGFKTRRLIKSEKYAETFPDIQISQEQDTKGYFTNTRMGERRATSTGATITGRHAHAIIIDDPVNPSGVKSENEMNGVNTYLSETLPSRCINQSWTLIALIMQRLGLEDPTGVRLMKDAEKQGGCPVRHICLPAEISDQVKPKVFKNKYRQGLLDPVRLPKRVLQAKRAELGAFGYAGQFEQLPVPLTGGLFQTDKFKFEPMPTDFSAFTKVIRWWDKAATAAGGKYTAGVLMGFRQEVPQVWIFDVVRKQVDSSAREKLIRKTAEADRAMFGMKYKVGLEQEPGSGGVDSTQATIRNLVGFAVVAEKPTGDKEERADPFATYVNEGWVVLVRAPWNGPYINELEHFDKFAKYTDQTDASSGAFKNVTAKLIKVGAGGF